MRTATVMHAAARPAPPRSLARALQVARGDCDRCAMLQQLPRDFKADAAVATCGVEGVEGVQICFGGDRLFSSVLLRRLERAYQYQVPLGGLWVCERMRGLQAWCTGLVLAIGLWHGPQPRNACARAACAQGGAPTSDHGMAPLLAGDVRACPSKDAHRARISQVLCRSCGVRLEDWGRRGRAKAFESLRVTCSGGVTKAPAETCRPP